MMKKVLVISTSLRSGSNSELLALECQKGAIEAGHEVELVSLKGKKLNFCIGCLSCKKTQKCIHQDDVKEILEKAKNSDVIVFSTPIYYYEMSGQMKVLLDRLNPLYYSDYKFREVYMIACAADTEKDTFTKAYQGLQGWVDCFEKASLKGILSTGGAENPKDVLQLDRVMAKAYELGHNI